MSTKVETDESFFDLGGDSLAAMRVIGAVNTAFDVQLPLGSVFNAPSVAELAARLGRDSGGSRPLVARERPAVVPLSFAQSRLWFIGQLQGPSPVYNRTGALRLTGPLDTEALGLALSDVVRRHESLRTVFSAVDGIAQQRVLPADRCDFGWKAVDATGWTEAQLTEAIQEVAGYSFDLATEIPFRAQVFSTSAHDHVLVVVVHHIAGDGWSVGVLAKDISEAYASRYRGRSPDWADLPVQYADYTLWQRDRLGDLNDPTSRLAGQLRFWETALAGMPQRLELPTDRPYPPVADHRGASVAVDWPAEVQDRIRDVAREYNATSFMVVQAALAVLLSRLTANPDVAVGFPIAGRGDPALNGLVGFFVNTLILRVDVGGDPDFAGLLAQVRERSLAAYEHQDVPFEALVERLNPARSLTHHPLVQAMLAWQNTASLRLTVADLEVTSMPVETRTAAMDLAFYLGERFTEAGEPAGIGGRVEFRTDVFDEETIEAFVDRLRRVLMSVTADPTAPLSSLALIDASEQARLDAWGNRAALQRTRVGRAVYSRSVRRAGRAHARRRGTHVRVRIVDLPRGRRSLEPAGAHAVRAWRRSRQVCGAVDGAFGAGRHRDPCRAQDRGRLSAAWISALPTRTPGIHGRRRRAGRRHDIGPPTSAVRRVRAAGDRCRRPPHRRILSRPTSAAARRRDRLPHLHLGHDRHAQGCGHHPPQPDSTHRVDGRRATPARGTGVVPMPFVRLRFLGMGDLGCAVAWRAPGGGT